MRVTILLYCDFVYIRKHDPSIESCIVESLCTWRFWSENYSNYCAYTVHILQQSRSRCKKLNYDLVGPAALRFRCGALATELYRVHFFTCQVLTTSLCMYTRVMLMCGIRVNILNCWARCLMEGSVEGFS